MKKLLLICLALTACSTEPAMLGYKNEKYPKLQENEVGVFYNAPIPQGCDQISMSMDEMDDDIADIVADLRIKAAERGANYANIESVHYVPTFAGNPDKFIHATYYLCK